MAFVTHTTTHQPNLFGRLAGTFDGLMRELKQRRLSRQTFNSLSALSDRDLEDLGLHRSNLREIARDAARNAL